MNKAKQPQKAVFSESDEEFLPDVKDSKHLPEQL